MKTKTITLYEYSELSDKAKEKALNDWNETNDDPLMQSHMINLLKEELDERGIKYNEDSIDVRYSLSCCQGDGFMFIGTVTWVGQDIEITHGDHRYCHELTARFETGDLASKDVDEFKDTYVSVCKKMEQVGYEHIEWYTSEDAFIEECEANGYTFRENGEMENA